MTGPQYARLIAEYLAHRFADRGVEVYREVDVGKSIIGKRRRVDILLVQPERSLMIAIECKYQAVRGTADEKIPYTLADMRALAIPGVIAYAGAGFSPGVTHMLQSSEIAARCLPSPHQSTQSDDTWELDHQIALRMGWWDVLVAGKAPVAP